MIYLKGYIMYSTLALANERTAGGSTICVSDRITDSYVNLSTGLQAVAIRIFLDKPITTCSIYIPLNSTLSTDKLQN